MSFVGHDDNPRYIELAAVTRADDPGPAISRRSMSCAIGRTSDLTTTADLCQRP